ncbi:MAG: thiazole biosynthesis adenylyltransferase ThiF [Planctomycetota bacterium]|nr:MAG: thiazole biosynthesis adenylyltransferase ThiF [Planctomycetota bacterium]
MAASASRYDRQIRLPQIGADGQAALRRASVAVIGLGALGSHGADLLARAGVGRLILIDRDVVEWSNLQRQSLYDERDAERARPKAEAAAERLRAVNADVELTVQLADLSAHNAPRLLHGATLLLDGTDNFATRYLLNDFSVQQRVAYVYAGVVSTYGLVGAVVPDGPCLRCTYPEPPDAANTPTCQSAGVFGPAVAVVAGLAAGEALKIASGNPRSAHAGFRYVDLWSGESRALGARQDPDCPCCGRRDFEWLEGRRGAPRAQALCGGGAVQLPGGEAAPDLAALGRKLQGTVGDLEVRERYLRFRDNGLELTLFADGRALVRGTEDPAAARALLARTVGA